MKLCTVIGARPQFIKAAALSRVITSTSRLNEIIVHTGQHYDANMSKVFFAELDIPAPKYNLGIGGGTHGQNTGRMIESIEQILLQEKPDWVLVYGDTDSTLAGAIAAAKLGVPVAHIEAGLRSFNRAMPEEINRILTDHASDLLFTPTDIATQNLLNEGIAAEKIRQVGDIMQDTAFFYQNKAQEIPGLRFKEGFILCTVHRAENTDDPARLSGIINALNALSEHTQVLFPVHPRTKKIIASAHLNTNNLTLIEPVSYLQMIWLLKQCALVVTDSGGLQKEAFFFGKPCVTTRHETEWVELVELGANCLAGSDENDIILAVKRMYSKKVVDAQSLYGNGKAASRIVESLL